MVTCIDESYYAKSASQYALINHIALVQHAYAHRCAGRTWRTASTRAPASDLTWSDACSPGVHMYLTEDYARLRALVADDSARPISWHVGQCYLKVVVCINQVVNTESWPTRLLSEWWDRPASNLVGWASLLAISPCQHACRDEACAQPQAWLSATPLHGRARAQANPLVYGSSLDCLVGSGPGPWF